MATVYLAQSLCVVANATGYMLSGASAIAFIGARKPRCIWPMLDMRSLLIGSA